MTQPTRSRPGVPVLLLVVLALLSSLAPLSVDMYLPGFTDIADDLSTSASAVQLTLTTFLAGLAIGQLVIGPLSDRFGRKAPLLLSLGICTLASVGTAVTPNVEVLVALRFVQGFTGSAGLVIGRSMVTDIASGRVAVSAFSLLAAISGLGPVASPLLGGLLIPSIEWRGVLWVLALFTAAMTLCVVLLVRESHPVERRSAGGLGETARTVRALGANTSYVSHLLLSFLAFGAIFAYVAASPFVLQNVYGLSTRMYSIAFALNAVALLCSNLINARLVARVHPARILAAAQVGLAVVALVLAATVLSGLATALTICLCLAAMMFAIGFVTANGSALAMVSVSRGTGTAAALIGSTQFGFGALVSPLVGLGGEESATAMVACIAAVALLGLAALALARRHPVHLAGPTTGSRDPVSVPGH